MELEWVMGCGLGWFVGPQLLLCDGLSWVGLKKLDPRTTLWLFDTQRRRRTLTDWLTCLLITRAEPIFTRQKRRATDYQRSVRRHQAPSTRFVMMSYRDLR